MRTESIKLWTYVGSNGLTESEVIAKYEIMDGLPVRGENFAVFW